MTDLDSILNKYADIFEKRENFGSYSEMGTLVNLMQELVENDVDLSVFDFRVPAVLVDLDYAYGVALVKAGRDSSTARALPDGTFGIITTIKTARWVAQQINGNTPPLKATKHLVDEFVTDDCVLPVNFERIMKIAADRLK